MNIENLVEQCRRQLPNNWKRAPWTHLNHGVEALDSDDKLNAYIAAYGEMHVAKCRMAMQNFPFDDLWIKDNRGNKTNHIRNFDVFDWGCGQGIGVLTFLELLEEREMLHGIDTINLIEPSGFALKRAKEWVMQAANRATTINSIERFIPMNGEEKWDDICSNNKIVIHIFSNILDIRAIGLRWLAETTSRMGDINYFICVGPKFGGPISRIEDFYNLHNRPMAFADFSSFPCGYTKDTHHPYGIEVKCFVKNKSDDLDEAYIESSDQTHTEEYQAGDECLQGLVSPAVIEAYHNLKLEISTSSELYFMPALGVERPDFVYANISRGIVIINVCSDISQFGREFERLEAIKKSLFDIYVKSLKINSIINTRTYNSIKIALYFPAHITDSEISEAKQKYYEDLLNKLRVQNSSSSYYPNNPTRFLLVLTKENREDKFRTLRADGFSFSFYNEITNLIKGEWHPYTKGDLSFKLTTRQKELLKYDSNRLRIRGVAGCGKTHLIAYLAVKEHLRTGKRVLIVTYNIALIKYIQMRINQVPADFSNGMFDIINYHQFFWTKGKRYKNDSLHLQAADDPHFFDDAMEEIKINKDQYDTIIVDEVQDFTTEWLDMLRKYFLANNGRFILLGDGEQNIFSRDLDQEVKMPRVNGFSNSPWRPMSDRYRLTLRQKNPRIGILTSSFLSKFNISNDPLEMDNTLNLEGYKIKYFTTTQNIAAKNLAEGIRNIIDNSQLNNRDTVILAPSIDVLREIEYFFNQQNIKTITTFETKKELLDLKDKHTLNGVLNSGALNMDLRAIRRVAKVHFTTDTDSLKLATIQSFKGWESKNVILLVQKEVDDLKNSGENGFIIQRHENMDALIYTGLTRAKENLYIINLGYKKYHQFFKDNIQND